MAKIVTNNAFIKTIIRQFSCGIILHKNRESRFMTKIMKGSSSKRKWNSDAYSAQPVTFTPTNITKGASEGKRSTNSRRVTVLNKLFMRHITDLMATGDNAAEFLGKGIEINRVMVTPDFQGVNVFWIAKGTENDNKLEALLMKNSGTLRHELSQLRVMGVVPKINFVKDREFAKLMEVDLRLAKADFGEDFVPTEPSYMLKSELSLNTQIPSHLKEKIEAIENEDISEEFEDIPLPPMRMDVLGLNHNMIMQKVKQLKKKSQALHRKNVEKTDENQIPNTYNDDPVEYESQTQQKEAFQQFLLKRQILKAKATRLKSKSYPEYEYLRNSVGESLDDDTLPNDLIDTEKDYIDDETEENIKL